MRELEDGKRIAITVRLPEKLARRFKAALALEGKKAQDVLEGTAREFTDKIIPE